MILKKMIKKVTIYIFGVILLSALFGFGAKDFTKTPSKGYYLDSLTYPQYIKNLITYNKYYPFIRYNQNYIEWNDYSSIQKLFKKFKQIQSRKLKVLHIGDSHVQADVFTGYIRNQIQNIMGDGGRGFVFPYAAAGTHSAFDYKTSCKGKWDFSRNIQPLPAYDMGITGATIYTEDSSASFKIIFSKGTLKKNFNVVKLYCKRSLESFDVKIKASGTSTPLYVDCNISNDKFYIEINLPTASDTLELFINKTDSAQKSFELYGLLVETSENKGVLYNSVGINGAGLKSILKENLLLYHLTELKADLVIVDLGLNDFYKVAFNSTEIENNLCNIIDIIQRATPDASIILCDGQDVYYRYWNEANCKTYSDLVRKIASLKGCAFYNYYNVSGGQFSMLKWYSNKLAKYDKVHLTTAGYFLRGELFLNALLNSYYLSLTKPDLKNFIASKEFPDTIKTDINFINKEIPELSDTDAVASAIKEQTQVWKTETSYYKIKSGDNLGAIALKYGVTVKQLQSWNKLKSSNINAGKTLIIYKQKLTIQTPKNDVISTKTQTKQTTNKPKQTETKSQTKKTINTKGKIKYTVKNGDNLWNISKKYNVNVDQIKKLNNLSNNALKPGMVLIISN